MYAFLNDISLKHSTSTDSFTLLSEVIDISNHIAEEYAIEGVKVPSDFKTTKVGGQFSIVELIANYSDESDTDARVKLIDFLSNRVFTDIDEIEAEILKEIESKNAWVYVSLSEPSMFLTGSYLLARPTISLRSDPYFEVDWLRCNLNIEYSDQKTKTTDIAVNNLYSLSNCNNHKAALVELKNIKRFGIRNWDATEDPIWNKKTGELLTRLEFPQSIDGRKEKISELITVGTLVAELNGWRKDSEMTRINKSKNKKRLIFTPVSRPGRSYLSIDMKNPKGNFEHYDYRGHHLAEITYVDGTPIPRKGSATGQDKSGKHNLKLKR